jgi:flagellar basal-body rod modification protein FlgD
MSLASFSAIDINQPATNSAAPASSNSGESLKNEFLTLMVAQLQNQNPLEPMDGAEYVSQLAEFTQVDSAETLNRLMQSNTATLGNLQSLAVSDLVGRQVVVNTNQLELGESAVEVSVTGPRTPLPVTAVFSDQYGNTKEAFIDMRNGIANFSLEANSFGLSGRVMVEFPERQDMRFNVKGEVSSVQLSPTGGEPRIRVDGVGEVPMYQLIQFGI